MSHTMFRRAALDRLSSPEGLDTLLTIGSARSWLALIAVLALVAAGLVWSVVGTIPISIRATAVIVRPGGVLGARATIAGRVAALMVKEGDAVRKGQPIATIDRSDQSGASESAPQASVNSPADGTVVEVAVDAGEAVTAGLAIATVQVGERAAGLQAVMYVPPTVERTVAPGMPVQIALSGSPAEEYGFLLARVASVSAVPATHVSMMRVLANERLVTDVSRDGAPFAVYATLESDPASASGFRWSSPRGGALSVNGGTIGAASIITRRQHPIELLIPWLGGPNGS